MSSRVLVLDAVHKIGETIELRGWVSVRRDHGKLIFLELRDRSGSVQLVVTPEKENVLTVAKEVRPEYTVSVTGLVKERPGKATESSPTGGIEIEVTSLSILSQPAEELPIDVSKTDLELNLDTLLTHRTLALRNEKVRAIFKIYSEMLFAYGEALRQEGLLEIKTPKILSAATEGGANFFKIKYFDRDAFWHRALSSTSRLLRVPLSESLRWVLCFERSQVLLLAM